MILDAASSRTCRGASCGSPSDGSPQNHPACPCSRPGPHSAAVACRGPTASASPTPPVFTHSYFHVKSFELKITLPRANRPPEDPPRIVMNWLRGMRVSGVGLDLGPCRYP